MQTDKPVPPPPLAPGKAPSPLIEKLDGELGRAAPYGMRNPRTRRLSLLFLEDSHFICQTISLLLNDSHLRLHFAATGEEAVKAYIANPPHMLFLDVELPDVNGFDVLKLVMKHDPRAYVVMLTGQVDAVSIRMAKELGARGYIAKPFNRQKLMECVVRYQDSY